MYGAFMQILYTVEELLWMRGILQVEFTKKKARLVAAGMLFAAALAFQGILGGGENTAPVFIGIRMALVPVVFAGAAGISLLKFLFGLFFINILTNPIDTVFFILGRHLNFYWPKERGMFFYDLVLVGIVGVIAWQLKRKESWKEKIRAIPTRYYAIGLGLSFCADGISFFVKSAEIHMSLATRDFLDVMCALLTELIYLLWLFLVVLDDLRRKYQKESLLKSRYLEMAKGHYRSLEDHVTKVRRIRHDMKYHLVVIGEYLEQGQVKAAQTYLEQEGIRLTALTVTPYDAGNCLVNAVIASEKEAMPPGMELRCEGELPQGMEVADHDLCCIFANLLSNGREACERLSEKKKEIVLRMRQKDGKMVLLVENPVEWDVDVGNLISHTTKEDAEDHGYGLLNVKETVESYGGDFEICVRDGIFQATVIL